MVLGSYGFGGSPGSTITNVDAYGQPVYSDQMMYVSMIIRIDGVNHPTWSINQGYVVPQPSVSVAPVAAPSPVLATVATPTPAPQAAHLLFSPAAIGASTFLAIGRCRLPGIMIWAAGVTASTSALISSLLTCALAYCEPIDPTESIFIQQMSANGTVFYDLDQGGVVTLGAVSAADMQQLRTCIANMRIYYGGEGQLPDPTIAANLGGTANTPAFRGLRYIVLIDFPLSVSGNAVPNIAIEWRRTGDPSLSVSDVLIAVAAHRGITLSAAGITATCKGFVTNTQGSLIDLLTKHRNPYNFQIIDGSPIRIVQRAIGGSLTINLEATEANCVRATPTVSMSRVDPATLPRGVEIQYTDPAAAYDTKVQPARHDGGGVAAAVISMPIDFVIDKNTARQMAFDTLYRIRSRGMSGRFELKGIESEVSDIIRMTCSQGVITFLVEDQTYTKVRTNTIRATALLTESGIAIDGGSGPTRPVGLLWPEQAVNGSMVGVVNGKIYAADTTTPYFGITINGTTPSRKIGLSSLFADPVYEIASDFASDGGYVYISTTNGGLVRINQFDFTDTTSIEDLILNPPYDSIEQIVAYSGRLYFAVSSDHATATPMRLYAMDLANFGASGLTYMDLAAAPFSASDRFVVGGICIVGNKALISSNKFVGSGGPGHFDPTDLYIVDLTTFVVTITTLVGNFGRGLSHGGYGYFLPATVEIDLVFLFPRHATPLTIVKYDPAGPVYSYVNITTDPNIINAADYAYPKPWTDGTNLCFMANLELAGADVDVGYVNDPYLARFNLTTLASAGGIFLAPYFSGFNSTDGGVAYLYNGTYSDGKHYISGDGWGDRYQGGVFVILESDLSGVTVYPTLPAAAANDDFAAPAFLHAGETLSAIATWATKETGEPNHASNFGGHSLWWLFSPLITGQYTVDARGSSFDSLVGVYTGDDLATLTTLASGHNVAVTFYARIGTQYHIAVDGYGGATGEAVIAMSNVTIISTDDDENFLLVIA